MKIKGAKAKNRTVRTSVRNSSNKYKNNFKYNYLNLNSVNNEEKILKDKLYRRKNDSRFLTKENFFPKNIFSDLNRDKEKLTFDNGCNSTKTSFRNCRINNDLNDNKSLKKFQSQYIIY